MLPPKRMVGSLSVDFLKQRRADLEEWLIKLAEHPTHSGGRDPQGNTYYRLFLTEDANKPPPSLSRVYPIYIAENKSADTRTFEGSKAQDKSHKVSVEDFELVRVIGKGNVQKIDFRK